MTDESPEARRRAFRVVSGGETRPALPPGPLVFDAPPEAVPSEPVHTDMPGGPRVLAPGAPPSPGTAPLEIARHLRLGEALVWWDAKAGYDLRPLAWIGGISAAVLLVASLVAPEFWDQPFADLWRPIAVLLSPMLLWLFREQFSQRAILVTDTAILEVPRRGEPQRLQFSAVQQVRRDLLTGGVVLTGKLSKIRVPASLVDRARVAIASQRKGALRSKAERPDDPLRFMG
ncbi:hypothetical protein [Nannocystis punicea]|uniref:PH domain-containing protein n=1 Tax=Nannocystis punicea TaxID=2995304 RepID=A0ABY7H1Y2_9BACT|nr:hypothetical protein [Nannocystis poenicansa]WAS93125.1 hypothetical protein O0S08_43740 [Nannocystis poenicansa]